MYIPSFEKEDKYLYVPRPFKCWVTSSPYPRLIVDYGEVPAAIQLLVPRNSKYDYGKIAHTSASPFRLLFPEIRLIIRTFSLSHRRCASGIWRIADEITSGHMRPFTMLMLTLVAMLKVSIFVSFVTPKLYDMLAQTSFTNASIFDETKSHAWLLSSTIDGALAVAYINATLMMLLVTIRAARY